MNTDRPDNPRPSLSEFTGIGDSTDLKVLDTPRLLRYLYDVGKYAGRYGVTIESVNLQIDITTELVVRMHR